MADRAHRWTEANPLWPPRADIDQRYLKIGFASVIVPYEFGGTVRADESRKVGLWHCSTSHGSEDSCLLSNLPLFSAVTHYNSSEKDSAVKAFSPNGQPVVLVYYEVQIASMPPEESGIALGFIAPPYPTWRLPGWERSSLGVHGDDGRRYVNDTWGGRDFVDPFHRGETVGLGMEFQVHSGDNPPGYGFGQSEKHSGSLSGQRRGVNVFLTRNGERRPEWEWDLHEEVDAAMDQPGGVKGLQGECDLHAAIGVYGAGCDFKIAFGKHNWMYRPAERQ